MNRVYSFDTTIPCKECRNPDFEVKVTATYTSEWTVEDVEVIAKDTGEKVELSVAQADIVVTRAAERWEDAKKEYENALAEANFEMQRDDLLH